MLNKTVLISLFTLLSRLAMADHFLQQFNLIHRAATNGIEATFLANCQEQSQLKVINGMETNRYPAIGLLNRALDVSNLTKKENDFISIGNCTATLIKPNMLLTAAHCVDNQKPGENIPSTGPFLWNKKKLNIKKIHLHPNHNKKENNNFENYSHDMAIIELTDNISGITPMPLSFIKEAVGSEISLVGFGDNQTGEGERPPLKRIGFNTIDNYKDGVIYFGGRVKNNSFLGFEKPLWGYVDMVDGTNASVANGDSGGPALKDGKLIGVITASTSVNGLTVDNEFVNFVAPLSDQSNQKFINSVLNP